MKLSEIKILEQNPRAIRSERFKKLCVSIKEFPKMLELRPIIIDENKNIIGGNMRYRALLELGYKEVPKEWIKQANEFTEEEIKRFIITDNLGFGDWDYDLLENEWNTQELMKWGVDLPKWDISKDLNDNDTKNNEDNEEDEDVLSPFEDDDYIFESNNEFEVPNLLLEKQATKLILPFAPWGADSRAKKGVSTYHFYVDDYRFENIFKNPTKVLLSGVKAIVEPNISTFDTTPVAYGLHLIYKKRWISRFFQENGIKVYADLNVANKFKEYNKLGIPKGYNAFFTRGYTNRLEYLKKEIKIAQEISGKEIPNLLVYGGGKRVKELCVKYSLVYIEQFMQNRGNNSK